MKHLWIILFVIIGCSNAKLGTITPEVEIPSYNIDNITIPHRVQLSYDGHRWRRGVSIAPNTSGYYYCEIHNLRELVRIKSPSETLLDENEPEE